MRLRFSIRLPALVVVALALAACSSSGGAKQTVAGAKVNFHGTKDVTGMSSVDIEADNFYFDPTVLKGTPGQHLTITIKNGSDTEHNFTVDSQHVDQDIEDGNTETVSVTLPPSGTIQFFCKYHHGSGMAGGLQSS